MEGKREMFTSVWFIAIFATTLAGKGAWTDLT